MLSTRYAAQIGAHNGPVDQNMFLGEEEYAHTPNKSIVYHNETASTSLGPATMRHYQVSQRYLGRFLKDKYEADDIVTGLPEARITSAL